MVFCEHQFMWIYHDDYGYASLSYAYNVQDVIGHNFNITQLFEFLIGHYNNWGGRVLYFAIECFFLGKSLFLFRLVQSIIITLIFYYIYKILKKYIKTDDFILAILSICCYGFIEIMVIRAGIFWATASILYVFPLLPLLMFIYYYDSLNKKISFNILMGFLIFASTFSQEQISVAALAYIGIITLYEWIETKKLNKKNIVMFIIGLLGFLILMMAPGSKARMNHPSSQEFYALSIFGKIMKNYPILIINVFSHYSKIFIVLFLFAITYLSFHNWKRKDNIVNQISLLSNLIILLLTVFSNATYFEIIYDLFQSKILKLLVLLIFSIQLLSMIYSVILFFYEKKQYIFIWITVIAILSQAAMIMAPYYPLRSVIIFEILMDMVIVYCIVDFIREKQFKWILILAIAFVSLFNLFTITRGYYRNNYINQKNNEVLLNASYEIQNGKHIEMIELNKLPDLTYSGDQPYVEGDEYIFTWIKEYYNLPEDIEIIYR